MNFLNLCQPKSLSQLSEQNDNNVFTVKHRQMKNYYPSETVKAINPIRQIAKKSISIIQTGDYICQCFTPLFDSNINGEVLVKSKKNNKVLYEGQFMNSQKCGYGIEYDQNGNFVYEGQFFDGKRHGWGKTDQYQGEFRANHFDGWGRFISKDIFYEGYFSEGKYNGIGVYLKAHNFFKNEEKIKSQRSMDDFIIDEMGKSEDFLSTYNIEQIYIGQWLKGFKNGSGKIWKQNGFWYIGQFAYGIIHGTGACVNNAEQKGVQRGVFVKGKFKKAL